MRGWFRAGMVSALGLLIGSSPVWGQVVRERDTTITGPRGRSIQRDLKSIRGPGFIDRQTTITRPGGTFTSNVLTQRRTPFVGGGGGWVGPRPWVGPGRPPVFVENVVVPGGPGPLGGVFPFLGGLGLGLGAGALVGAAAATPPPPPPVVVAQPPTVVVAQPQPYGAAPPPPPTVVVDPVAQAIARLSSYHGASRRDGAVTLGRLRDPRAIPALVDRLKYDNDKEVRIAAATALGEIGDPGASIYLERVTVYDKKKEVRDAAMIALSRLPHAPPTGNTAPFAAPSTTMAPPLTSASVPSVAPIENVPPPPSPDPPPPSVRR